jgi:nucleotidyltransferase substrate binding protein (TIGR01987 family)
LAIRLDLSSLAKAVARLSEALEALDETPDNSLYRDATIQRFEFTYELAHKLLRRYLEMAAATPQSIDEMAFQDLIRTGSEQGLLRSGWDRWKDYRKARGTISHTYDADKAMEVLAIVPDFLLEARHLHDELARRTEAP